MIKVIITYDVEGWCYASRAMSLQANAPEDFAVMIGPWQRVLGNPEFDMSLFDLSFNLDTAMTQRLGSCPHVLSWNSDPNRRGDRWQHAYESCDFLLMNNKATFEAHGRAQRTCCVANGVDTDIFRVLDPIEGRRERVFWTGSLNPQKRKGFDIIQAAAQELHRHGFELAAYPVESAYSKPFTSEGMVEQYNSASYVLCLSASDASPNTSLEGMACGCCLVTTRVGNALEMPQSPETCVFIDRSVDGLIDGLLRAREKRIQIATAGMRLMHDHWSYGEPGRRAKVFFDLLRRIANHETVEPFSYDELE